MTVVKGSNCNIHASRVSRTLQMMNQKLQPTSITPQIFKDADDEITTELVTNENWHQIADGTGS